MEFLTYSPEQTEKVGAALGKILPAGTILAYRGDLDEIINALATADQAEKLKNAAK